MTDLADYTGSAGPFLVPVHGITCYGCLLDMYGFGMCSEHDAQEHYHRSIGAIGEPAQGDNGKWVWIPDDTTPDQPYDDRRDHAPCESCNPGGRGKNPGWHIGLNGREHCRDCEGAGWL